MDTSWPTEVFPSFDSHFSLLSDSNVLQEELAKLETEFLAERELRHRSLAAQKVQIDRLWLKDASEKHLRAVSWWELGSAETPWGGCAAGPPSPGASSSGGHDKCPCSKPGTTWPWTSPPCCHRTRCWVSAWRGPGAGEPEEEEEEAASFLPCPFLLPRH